MLLSFFKEEEASDTVRCIKELIPLMVEIVAENQKEDIPDRRDA